MLKRFRLWRQSGVRGIGPGMKDPRGWYVRYTPNWGACINWFNGSRLRIAKHHGIQRVIWYGQGWSVDKQFLRTRSRVVKERYVPGVRDKI